MRAAATAACRRGWRHGQPAARRGASADSESRPGFSPGRSGRLRTPARPRPPPGPLGHLSPVPAWCRAGRRWPGGRLGTRDPRGLWLDSVSSASAPTAAPVKRQEPREPRPVGPPASERQGRPPRPGAAGWPRRGRAPTGRPGGLRRSRGVSCASRYFCSFWRRSPGPFENSSVGQNGSL